MADWQATHGFSQGYQGFSQGYQTNNQQTQNEVPLDTLGNGVHYEDSTVNRVVEDRVRDVLRESTREGDLFLHEEEENSQVQAGHFDLSRSIAAGQLDTAFVDPAAPLTSSPPPAGPSDSSPRNRMKDSVEELGQFYDGNVTQIYSKRSPFAGVTEHVTSLFEDFYAYYLFTKSVLFTEAGWRLTWRRFQNDWKSGATVALVNLPLSISLAVAADSTPVAGVSTAIWSGLFTALLGGCVYNIVGPTGALSGILARNVAQYGMDALPYLAIVTGILCLIVFALKWEKYVLLVPSAVTEGFTIGVALIIALNQLNFALGLQGVPRHEHFIDNVMENIMAAPRADPWSLALFLTSFPLLLSLMLTWRSIPWVIIICTLGIILGMFSSFGIIPIHLQTLQTRYGDLQLELFVFPEFKTQYLTIDFFSSSLSIAFVAILETLISAKIADQMTKTQFNQRREVFGLGAANIVTGVAGGIPATAALARTALNIRSGASSRMSAFLNVIFVLILSFALLPFFKYLPLPVVAAVIVVVAVRMVDWHHIINFWKLDKGVFALTIVVVIICLVVDPTGGIVVGMIVSLLTFSDKISHVHSEMVVTDEEGQKTWVSDREISLAESERMKKMDLVKHMQQLHADDKTAFESEYTDIPSTKFHHGLHTVVYRITGQLTYVNGAGHKSRIMLFNDCECLILSLRYLFFVDLDGLDSLAEVIAHFEHEKKLVLISGVNLEVASLISKTDWFRKLMEEGKVCLNYLEALNYLERLAAQEGKVPKVANLSNF
jgi:SulP family sulfate permease